MSIAIAAQLYLLIGGIPGAIGFTIGLYLVLWCKFNLFTGKVGYAELKLNSVSKLLLILIGNIIGCFFISYLPIAQSLIAAKLEVSLIEVFVKAVICGILIFVAVEQYNQGREYAPMIAVPAFILCGAEHCIADICFLIASRTFTIEFIPFILVVILGNSIGSLITRFATRR